MKTQSIICHYHKTPIEVKHNQESFLVYCPKCIKQFGMNIAPPNAKPNTKELRHENN